MSNGSTHLDSVWNETDGTPRLQVNPLIRAFRSSIQQDDLGSLLLVLLQKGNAMRCERTTPDEVITWPQNTLLGNPSSLSCWRMLGLRK
jgi:hypothetical protein